MKIKVIEVNLTRHLKRFFGGFGALLLVIGAFSLCAGAITLAIGAIMFYIMFLGSNVWFGYKLLISLILMSPGAYLIGKSMEKDGIL